MVMLCWASGFDKIFKMMLWVQGLLHRSLYRFPTSHRACEVEARGHCLLMVPEMSARGLQPQVQVRGAVLAGPLAWQPLLLPTQGSELILEPLLSVLREDDRLARGQRCGTKRYTR
jgi:hypothetical protein